MIIRTKHEFREGMMAGLFGNRLKTWRSYFELQTSEYEGTVTARVFVADSNWTMYRIPVNQIPQVLENLKKAHERVDVDKVWFNESAPDEHLVLQGELWDHSLMYSRERVPMKQAMAKPLYAEGLQTEMLLRGCMNANSYEDLNELRVNYPDHCIEFSSYEHCLGNMPHRNTIIWEVRAY